MSLTLFCIKARSHLNSEFLNDTIFLNLFVVHFIQETSKFFDIKFN